MSDFTSIEVLYYIDGVLRCESPLRIGSGQALTPGATVDNPIVRYSVAYIDGQVVYNLPYIPGSSLKGVLRNLAEVIARSMGMNVCNPFRSECNAENACVVCRIFGNQQIASHITVYDGIPVRDSKPLTSVPVLRRVGVGIDRLLGGSARGVLYDDEFVTVGTEFTFKVKLVNIDLESKNVEEVAVLHRMLKWLVEEGIAIGGRTSVGFGHVVLDGERTRIIKKELKNGVLQVVDESSLSKKLTEWFE